MSKSIEERVKEVLADQLGIEESDCIGTAKLQDDLDADSLDLVECIMALEEEFDIEISDERCEAVVTVQDAIDIVTELAA